MKEDQKWLRNHIWDIDQSQLYHQFPKEIHLWKWRFPMKWSILMKWGNWDDNEILAMDMRWKKIKNDLENIFGILIKVNSTISYQRNLSMKFDFSVNLNDLRKYIDITISSDDSIWNSIKNNIESNLQILSLHIKIIISLRKIIIEKFPFLMIWLIFSDLMKYSW